MDPITTGALISAGGSLLSGLFNNSSSNARQEDQQAFNAEQYAKRYQIQVADMKAAGLS